MPNLNPRPPSCSALLDLVPSSLPTSVQPLLSQKRPPPDPPVSATTSTRTKRPRANVKYRNGKGPSRRMAATALTTSARLSSGIEMTNVSSDFCAACGAAGLYVCCDGCPRVFHPFCLDPPLSGVEEAGEHWYCRECDSTRPQHSPIPSTSNGLFSPLIQQQYHENPKSFKLPEGLRNRYENVATNPHTGDFVDESRIKTKKRLDGVKGYVDEPHPYQIKTRDGRTILCYHCGLGASSAKKLKILGCDECDQYFHLDCLDPPLVTPPPANVKWVCPLHADKAAPLRRFPKQSVTMMVTEPNTPNDGDIDVIVNSQKRIKARKVEEISINRVRYQVPENIIILDFWSKMAKSDHSQLLTSRTRESSPLTSLSSNLGSPRAPILGQDILPPSAATSEDASSLLTSPGRKAINLVLNQTGLGCSISGDASQPSSPTSSSDPLPSSAPELDRPDLSCLLKAASMASKPDELAPSEFATLDESASNPPPPPPQPTEPSPVKIKTRATRHSLLTSRRSSPPRTRTRGSGRPADSLMISNPSLSNPTGSNLEPLHVSKPSSNIEPTPSTSGTISKNAELPTGLGDPNLTSTKVSKPLNHLQKLNLSNPNPSTPTPSGSNSSRLPSIPSAKQKPRQSTNLATKKVKNTLTLDSAPSNVGVSKVSCAALETPQATSRKTSKDLTPAAETDGEGSSQLSKGPTRIRIKGTKYLERLAQASSDQQQANSGSLPLSQLGEQSSCSNESAKVHGKSFGFLLDRNLSLEQQSPAPLRKVPPSQKKPAICAGSSGPPSKNLTPRTRTVKRPSSVLGLSPLTSANSTANMRPGVLETRNGFEVPSQSSFTATPPEPALVKKRKKKVSTVPLDEPGRSTTENSIGIAAPSQPTQPNSANWTKFPFPLLPPEPPRKKPRRNNYPVGDPGGTGPSQQQKSAPNNNPKSAPLGGLANLSGSAHMIIPTLSPSTSLMTSQPAATNSSSVRNLPHTSASTDTNLLPWSKKSKFANKKRLVPASLASSSRSVETPLVSKTMFKQPPQDNGTDFARPTHTPSTSVEGKLSTSVVNGGTPVFTASSVPSHATVQPTRPIDSTRVPQQTSGAESTTIHTNLASASPSTSNCSTDPLLETGSTHPRKRGTGSVKSSISPRSSLHQSHLSPELLLPSNNPVSQRMSPVLQRPNSPFDQHLPILPRPTLLHPSRPKAVKSGAKITKAEVRKRVISVTGSPSRVGPGSLAEPPPVGVSDGGGGPSEESLLRRKVESLAGTPESISINKSDILSGLPSRKDVTSMASGPDSSTAEPSQPTAPLLRKKKKKLKAEADQPASSSAPASASAPISTPAPALTLSPVPVAASIPIPNFNAHSQTPLPYVPHPQNSLPFVPHPQHNFVPHPQHASPAQFVHPAGFVLHPQYPFAVLKTMPGPVPVSTAAKLPPAPPPSQLADTTPVTEQLRTPGEKEPQHLSPCPRPSHAVMLQPSAPLNTANNFNGYPAVEPAKVNPR